MKEHRQFRGVLGSWRTDADNRTTFHARQRCQKTAVLAEISQILGLIWRVKVFHDQQCQFLTRNKNLRSENKSNCCMTSECVRTDLILPKGVCPEHSQCKDSLSTFGIFVKRLSFYSFILLFSVFILAEGHVRKPWPLAGPWRLNCVCVRVYVYLSSVKIPSSIRLKSESRQVPEPPGCSGSAVHQNQVGFPSGSGPTATGIFLCHAQTE